MELQTLAVSTYRRRLEKYFAPFYTLRDRDSYPYVEDILFVLVLLTARADHRSLLAGGIVIASSLFLWAWLEGSGNKLETISGPYRFLRFPETLATWLFWVGISVSFRSFPGLLASVCLLPFFHWNDRRTFTGQRPSSHSIALRYEQYIPSLVPTLFPFQRLGSSEKTKVSWRRILMLFKGKRFHLSLVLVITLLAQTCQYFLGLNKLAPFAGLWLLVRTLQLLFQNRPSIRFYPKSRT